MGNAVLGGVSGEIKLTNTYINKIQYVYHLDIRLSNAIVDTNVIEGQTSFLIA